LAYGDGYKELTENDKFLNQLEKEDDPNNVSVKYKQQIEVYKANEQGREEIFRNLMDPHTLLNQVESGFAIKAFNGNIVEKTIRSKYYKKYWEELITFLSQVQLFRGETVLRDLMPKSMQDDEYMEEWHKLSWKFKEAQPKLGAILEGMYEEVKRNFRIKRAAFKSII